MRFVKHDKWIVRASGTMYIHTVQVWCEVLSLFISLFDDFEMCVFKKTKKMEIRVECKSKCDTFMLTFVSTTERECCDCRKNTVHLYIERSPILLFRMSGGEGSRCLTV